MVAILKTQEIAQPNITLEEKEALRGLKADDSIFITKADKGSVTVVMDKVKYVTKGKEHLESVPYRKITEKTVSAVMNRKKLEMSEYLKKVKDHLGIGRWYAVYPKSSIAPRFYGYPKIHKTGMPIRPVVDGRGSPPHEFARYLAKLLRSLTGHTRTHIRNSYEFAKKVSELRLENSEVLVSFDVTALFTNIPREEVRNLTQALLEDNEEVRGKTRLTPEEIAEGIKLCLNVDVFTFQNELYQQQEGLAMGSPISPVLADIYMENFEKKVFEGYQHPPRVWWRYVDDTFVVIDRGHLKCFFEFINSIDRHIQFTMEVESDEGKLPFLDCLVHRLPGGKVKTTVYRKPSDTDRILPYESEHPEQVHKSIVRSMFRRARLLCTEKEDQKRAIEEVKERFSKNGYPGKLLNRQLRLVIHPTQPRVRQWVKTVGIPYKKGTSEAIRKVLSAVNIRVAFRRGKSIGTELVHLKDTIPQEKISNCLYKLTCENCPVVYIGETGRELQARVAEHIRRTKKLPTNEYEYQTLVKDSAMAGHALDTGHNINFSDVKIIKKGFRSVSERLYAEAIEIAKHQNAVNRIEGVRLSEVWRAIMSRK